jgi:hypothetical protein
MRVGRADHQPALPEFELTRESAVCLLAVFPSFQASRGAIEPPKRNAHSLARPPSGWLGWVQPYVMVQREMEFLAFGVRVAKGWSVTSQDLLH